MTSAKHPCGANNSANFWHKVWVTLFFMATVVPLAGLNIYRELVSDPPQDDYIANLVGKCFVNASGTGGHADGGNQRTNTVTVLIDGKREIHIRGRLSEVSCDKIKS